MSETTYSIENAKSGRSSCKKCKVKIGKGEIRLGVNAPAGDYNMQSWYHTKCFTLPRKLVKQGIDAATFVADMLVDETEGNVLGDTTYDIVADIEYKLPKKKKGEEEGAVSGASKSMKRIKEDLAKIKAEAVDEEEDEDEGPKRKKVKKEKGKLSENDRARAEVFSMYQGCKNDELKDCLRWNKQMVGGNKDALMTRIIDGHLNGRLGRCPTCKQGRVKLTEDDGGETAYCNGYFDEENGVRVGCFFKCKIDKAPRLHPWYSKEPTEEETEAMEAQDEAAKSGGAVGVEQTEKAKEDTEKLTKLVKRIDWDMSHQPGVRQAAKDMLEIVKSCLAIPSDNKTARFEIGKIILANRNLPATEVLNEVIERFGFSEIKDEAKKKNKEALTSLCANPANAPLVEAFMEMSKLFFKSGDGIRGNANSKAAEAIKGIEFEINEENAHGLGKGKKTKVAGIGKGSAEKMYEFLTTGTVRFYSNYPSLW
uniref:PARP-type domain-containing protein n=1 Tax=Odontella aurita TaxID=265563 RepID=A0A7S4HQV9_9STRA|mmetsp:Transcript_13660/g.39909  ORF Transcript_13660/g.39909 Transcript_13660/m.39909 type:complete len:481 (+) Transcript_13660:245-1687(+)